MLLLTSTSDLVQVTTGSPQNVRVHASWVDYNGTTTTIPGRQNTNIAVASTVTVVPGPLAIAIERTVKALSIRNMDGAATVEVTVQHTDGTNLVTLCAVALLPGNTLTLTAAGLWVLTNAAGYRA